MSISGAALHAMIKLRKETSNNVAGRRQLSSDGRLKMELKLAILQSLVLPQNEKHQLPIGLRILNKGNLKFLHLTFI